jgi:hypothetical protein
MKKLQSVSFRLACLALVVVLFCAHAAQAQDVSATITGTIADPSGAPIVGATVTATDHDRGKSWPSTTNQDGIYNILRIPIGTYSLKAEAKGFQTSIYPAFTLVLNQVARVDIQMKMGAVTATVEVTGESPLLQTQSTEISTVIDANTTVNLPLASRNYVQLTLLAPGTTQPNPDTMRQGQLMTSSGRPYINGNREQSNNFLLDGIDNNETSNNEVGYSPSVDAVQEFNLITQNAPAEFGNFSGGIISTTLKSGTNNFHGTVYEFFRNNVLNANSWANNLNKLPRNQMRWNMFGGSLGGPIVKDKLFFFADYQGQRFDFPSSTQKSSVLTDAERAGNFGALCTEAGGSFSAAGVCTGGPQLVDPHTKIPIPFNNLATAGYTISPVAQALFASGAYPHAAIQTGTNIASGLNPNYFSQSTNALNNDQGDMRIDYNISDTDRVSGHYSQMSYLAPYGYTYALIGQPGMPATEPASNLGVDLTHSFTPTILNDLRGGYNKVIFNQNGSNASSTLGNFGEAIGIAGSNAFAPGLPNITFPNAPNFNMGAVGIVQEFHTTGIQFSDNLVITRGRHTIRTGGQFWQYWLQNAYSGNGGALGQLNVSNLTGFSGADFWLGLIQSGNRGSPATTFERRGSIFGAYVQDDWKITSAITLNLGLRFEDHTPFYEILNKEVNFGLYSGAINVAGQNGNGRALYNNYLGIADWQPRIGVAWSPERLRGRGVVRASYTVSSYSEGGGVNQQLTANPPFSGASSAVGAGSISTGFGPPVPQCSQIDTACYIGKSIHSWDPNWQPQVTQQWSLSAQYQFNNSTTLQVGYVGQHSTHLLNLMDYSQYQLLTPATYNAAGALVSAATYSPGPYLVGNAPLKASFNPTSSTWDFGTASNGNASYNALQVVLQKRMSDGLQGQVAYTYGKCMSNSGGFYGTWGATQASKGQVGWQNLYNPRGDWGPCFYDVTNTLSGYAVYQLPVGRGRKYGKDMNAVVNGIVGGWNIAPLVTWHGGYAMTLQNAWADPSGTGGLGSQFGNERPDCVGPVQYLKRADPSVLGYDWFSPNSFLGPKVGTFGNCGVGNVRGPGLFLFDFGLQKDFAITESKRLEFRAEFLNAFNNTVLSAPAANCSNYFTPSLTNPLSTPANLACGSTLGLVTGSQSERNVQFALKFYF